MQQPDPIECKVLLCLVFATTLSDLIDLNEKNMLISNMKWVFLKCNHVIILKLTYLSSTYVWATLYFYFIVCIGTNIFDLKEIM